MRRRIVPRLVEACVKAEPTDEKDEEDSLAAQEALIVGVRLNMTPYDEHMPFLRAFTVMYDDDVLDANRVYCGLGAFANAWLMPGERHRFAQRVRAKRTIHLKPLSSEDGDEFVEASRDMNERDWVVEEVFTVSYEAMQRAFGADGACYLELMGHQPRAKSVTFAAVDDLEAALIKLDASAVRPECRAWMDAVRNR